MKLFLLTLIADIFKSSCFLFYGFVVPVSFVVLRNGSTSETISEDLRALCENTLDSECVPVTFKVFDSIPVKPSGKRDMEKIKEMAVELIAYSQHKR